MPACNKALKTDLLLAAGGIVCMILINSIQDENHNREH